MPIKPGNPTGRGLRGNSLFEAAFPKADLMQIAKQPMTWFQLVDSAGNPQHVSENDKNAIYAGNRSRSPQDFVITARSDNDGGYFLWIQFNPGHWKKIAASRKEN